MITLPKNYNYIGLFLTLRCPYSCSYCINDYQFPKSKYEELKANKWVKFLNKLKINDVPVTLQGGEPFLYLELPTIINETKKEIKFDILTSLACNVEKFIKKVKPERLYRQAPYAPLRVSYHPEFIELKTLIKKVLTLMDKGFKVGVYGVLHPAYKDIILKAQEICLNKEIDFRTKPFLGFYKGKLYGEYKYPEGLIRNNNQQKVFCKTSELLIAPDGKIYKCHFDLYNSNGNYLHNIKDKNLKIVSKFRSCNFFGLCNPCDLKIKNNRFQQFGHCSVEIIYKHR